MTDAESPQLPIEVISRFLDNQSRELQAKEGEMTLRNQELQSQHEIALASIKAQSAAQECTRIHDHKMWVSRYWFIGALTVILTIAAAALVLIDAKEIVTDIMKILSGMAAGGFGGYFAGKNQAEKQSGD